MLPVVRLLCLPLTACLFLTACSPAPEPPAEVVRPVKVFTVADPLDEQVREFPARLKAPEEAQLSFRLGGQLQQLQVREGQKVKRGELIGELDNTDFQLRLNDRQATYDLTRSQLERMAQLVERQMVSRAEYEERQAQFNSAEAALNLTRQELAYTRLLAPFDGVVARTHVERFQVVQPNEPIITLYSGDSMDVVFQLPESLLAGLRPDINPIDYRPTVRLESLPGTQLEAVYKEHSSQPDPKTLTYQVTLSMPSPEGLVLLPGMTASVQVDFAQISLIGDLGMRVLVPVEAVFSPDSADAGIRQVWVLEEHEEGLKVQARDVIVGQLTHNGIEVMTGLKAGERIVAAGGGELIEGQSVRVWERERGL
ncbi:MAG: efflux RND transporter periplasmic adaptor subunit [Pseudomonas sp.]